MRRWGPLIGLSLWGLLLAVGFSERARAFDDADRAVYAAATAFCRTRPAQKLFDEPTKVVCFDGQILSDEDVSYIQQLPEHGLFVVRSPGGRLGGAEKIAKVLREKHADVVIYDYCLSACADFLFVASDRTYVMRDSIVAWHFGQVDNDTCGRVDRGKGLTRTVCSTGRSVTPPRLFAAAFLPERVTARDERILEPPMSAYVRRILVGYFEGTGVFRDIFWTWHPRYYKSLLRTEIEYQGYPESQEQLDDLLDKHLSRRLKFIYDP